MQNVSCLWTRFICIFSIRNLGHLCNINQLMYFHHMYMFLINSTIFGLIQHIKLQHIEFNREYINQKLFTGDISLKRFQGFQVLFTICFFNLLKQTLPSSIEPHCIKQFVTYKLCVKIFFNCYLKVELYQNTLKEKNHKMYKSFLIHINFDENIFH